MKAILTSMPQYVVGVVLLSREGFPTERAAEWSIVRMRAHMVH